MIEEHKISMIRYGVAILLGIIAAFLLEGGIAGYRVSRGYGKNSEFFSLVPANASGYIVGGEDGSFWKRTEADSWVVFYPEQETGHIRIRFRQPLEQEIDIRCLYGKNAIFSPFQRKLRYLLEGTQEAVITIPYGHWDSIRLDICGDFVLESFEGVGAVPLKAITLPQIVETVNKGQFAFFLFLFPMSGILMVQQGIRKKAVLQVGKREKERVVFFDAVRVLASLMVILTHVLSSIEGVYKLPERPAAYFASRFITMSCNQLFFMLSGALLLPWREEKVSVFFQKRMMKVVLPLLTYGWIYLCFLCSSKAPAGDMAIAYALSMIRGYVRMGPHLWMVFELIAMYILVVPFRGLLHYASEQTEKLLAIFILTLMGIMSVSQYTYLELGISTFLSEWTGVFLMGYLLKKDWMRKYDRFWMGGGILALVFGIILSFIRGSYSDFIFGTSVFMQLISSGIFVGILHLEKYLQKAKNILAFCSKYSYSVLLIHWFVLYSVVFIQGVSFNQPLVKMIFTAFACCTILSFIFAVFIDNTFIAVLEWGIGKINRKK